MLDRKQYIPSLDELLKTLQVRRDAPIINIHDVLHTIHHILTLSIPLFGFLDIPSTSLTPILDDLLRGYILLKQG